MKNTPNKKLVNIDQKIKLKIEQILKKHRNIRELNPGGFKLFFEMVNKVGFNFNFQP